MAAGAALVPSLVALIADNYKGRQQVTALGALGSARARQVNSYYNSLGEGLGKVVPPQVASVSGKPVSIAFEEIAAGKATFTRPDPEEEAALAAAIAHAHLSTTRARIMAAS